ncbi:MAG: carotenoid oxygenase family protein [Myxococcota bacterium]
MSADPTSTENPFLSGLMAPVLDERDDVGLEVEGELPGELRGLFVRNGPNPRFAPKDAYHPFDGDGMVHALYLADGEVRYRNRWIESKGLLAERKRGRACFGSLSKFSMPPEDVIEEAGFMKNTANTHFVRHDGHYFALMEAGRPTELSRDLETLGEYDFGGALPGAMTAHPKIDPVTGDLVFFGYSPVPPFLQYYVVDRSGRMVHHEVIDIPNPVMMHDFVATENYTVFLDSPAIFDVEAMMQDGPAMRWEPEKGTRLGVIPRFGRADEVRWFEVDPCYVVHFFNAWDEGDRIEIHAPSFASMPGGLQFDDPSQTEEPYPRRFQIDLSAGSVKSEQTDDRPGEFPRVNDERACRRHRYQYDTTARSWEFEFDFDGVVKYDLETGGSTVFAHGRNEVCGEHVFVPRPGARAEDDGWLMTHVSDRETMRSKVVLLDARDLEAGPVAQIHMPRRVPIGFHANWLPDGPDGAPG